MTNEIVTTAGETTELSTPENFAQSMAFLNPADMPDLDNAEAGISIEPKYHEFQIGEVLRAIFNGIGHITKKNDSGEGYTNVPAVVLQTKDGIKLNAGASLVNQMQNIPAGTAIQITYTGQEKTNNGFKVNKFDVRLLNVKRVNMPAPVAQKAIEKQAAQVYTNMQMASEYWTKVYSPAFKFTEQEGKDHLAACGNDFKVAIAALSNSDPNPFA